MKLSRILSIALGIVIIGAAIFLGVTYFRDMEPPLVAVNVDSRAITRDRDIAVALSDEKSGLRLVRLVAVQDGKRTTILEKSFTGQPTAEISAKLGDASLVDGPFILEITATDASNYNFGAGNTATLTWEMVLDTRRPVISLESQFHNLNRGGSGLAVYTIDEEVARSGVKVGETFFPGYRQPDGRHAALFAFPWFMERKDFAPVVLAEDLAGNTRERPLPFHANDRRFRHDTITISDRFLDSKMDQFESDFPAAPGRLELFLKVNRQLREANLQRMHELGQTSSPAPLWDRVFLRADGKPMAGFADHRTYLYNGETIDHQVHLGVDIADVANAPIPAANSGVVVLAEFFGIYGKTVVIDHGLGLMTLYSHLSQLDVHEGDRVDRGQTIGRSGATGMAGGDHLHFEVFVSGLSVTPFEWWDAQWIENNFASKLRQ